MYCPSCGSAILEGAGYCVTCGRAITGPATSAVAPYAGPFRLIESVYTIDQLVTASPGRRLGGYLLNLVIFIFTIGVGWFIWFAIVAPRGQTPGKQLLGMYIIKADGTRAGGGYTWVRTILVRGLLTIAIDMVTFSIYGLLAQLWCIWDREHQCLWDKIAGTRIAYSPHGYRPLTANELMISGQLPPVVARSLGSPPPPSPSRLPMD